MGSPRERATMIEALLQAERLLVHGMVDQAEEIYVNAVQQDPRNAIAMVGLARVALERTDDRLAYQRALAALEIDPENVAALRLEARLSEILAGRGEQVTRPAWLAAASMPTDEPARQPPAQPTSTQPPSNHRPPAQHSAEQRPSETHVLAHNPSMANHRDQEERRSQATADAVDSGGHEGSGGSTPATTDRRGLLRRLLGR